MWLVMVEYGDNTVLGSHFDKQQVCPEAGYEMTNEVYSMLIVLPVVDRAVNDDGRDCQEVVLSCSNDLVRLAEIIGVRRTNTKIGQAVAIHTVLQCIAVDEPSDDVAGSPSIRRHQCHHDRRTFFKCAK